MKSIEYSKKMLVRKFVENECYHNGKKEEINLLKGSIKIDQLNEIEAIIKDKKHDKELEIICIGKLLVFLTDNGKKIFKMISVKDYDIGVQNLKECLGDMYKKHEKENESQIRLKKLEDEFMNLKQTDKIEKGRILIEIESILAENKGFGKKKDMWEKLDISSSDKSMLCKRYYLFKNLENSEVFLGEKDLKLTIENMTDLKLKEVTKKGISKEECENLILSLMIKE